MAAASSAPKACERGWVWISYTGRFLPVPTMSSGSVRDVKIGVLNGFQRTLRDREPADLVVSYPAGTPLAEDTKLMALPDAAGTSKGNALVITLERSVIAGELSLAVVCWPSPNASFPVFVVWHALLSFFPLCCCFFDGLALVVMLVIQRWRTGRAISSTERQAPMSLPSREPSRDMHSRHAATPLTCWRGCSWLAWTTR